MRKSKRATALKAWCLSAVMGGIGFVLMLAEFPLAFIIPSFIKFDFSELPALITAFAIGPLYGAAVCLIKNLLHLFISQTAGVGELANFLLGSVFVCTAGVIYKTRKSRKTAFIGSLAGALFAAFVSVPVNLFITYPFYGNFMSMDAVVQLYQAILPCSNTLLKCLIIFNMPFTFLKGLADTAICMVIYKKISPIFK